MGLILRFCRENIKNLEVVTVAGDHEAVCLPAVRQRLFKDDRRAQQGVRARAVAVMPAAVMPAAALLSPQV